LTGARPRLDEALLEHAESVDDDQKDEAEDPVHPSTHRKNAQGATISPERSSEECHAETGAFVPVIDRAKCEGKSECVAVCPCEVFEVRRMDDGDFANLTVLGKLKSIAHGRKTAYTPNATECRACRLCVAACPERAIRLVAASPDLARTRQLPG
jgi:NAD-dependent dihydropyrimidine dehydrogenase PreA subunit